MNDNTSENAPPPWQNQKLPPIVQFLLIRFERQLLTKQLNSPFGDNCVQTLGKLADHAYDPDELQQLVRRLELALEEEIALAELLARLDATLEDNPQFSGYLNPDKKQNTTDSPNPGGGVLSAQEIEALEAVIREPEASNHLPSGQEVKNLLSEQEVEDLLAMLQDAGDGRA